MQRKFEWPTCIEQVRDRLTSFCERQPLYPALTPRQLQELGVFDGRIMDFLRSRGVTFHPFTSSDPTNKIVLEVHYSKHNLQLLLKSDLRRPEE
jgi:hypothetical protein